MKAIVSISIAVISLVSNHPRYGYAALIIGVILYVINANKPLSEQQKRDADIWALVLLFILLIAFIWACVYRIYVRGLLF